MEKARTVFKTILLGGLLVILPVTIVAGVFVWLYGGITGLIEPLTRLLLERADLPGFVADLTVIALIVFFCFIVGVLVKTGWGRFVHQRLEKRVLELAPGYSTIKEALNQFLGRSKPPFSSVALVRPFESEALITGFVTDEHPDGWYTVFLPTGPNPTSGLIYHLPAERVRLIDAGVEQAMRTIISCGAGSSRLLEMRHADNAPR